MAQQAALHQAPPVGVLDEPSSAAIDRNGQYVTFSCNKRNFGVDIMSVREIRSWSVTTLLPDQPKGACGVLDIRGEIIQVFDLGVLLGDGPTNVTQGHVVLVVALENGTIGILVDAVSDIIQVAPDQMRAAPKSSVHARGVVSGLAKREDDIVAVLNLSRLLEAESDF